MIVADRVTVAARGIFSQIRSARRTAVQIASASLLLVALPFLFRLDGRVHADWLQFLGRFHPLLLHLPIGLIVLVPLLEIAGAKRPALREAADFVLGAALALALSTLALGYMLAYGAGDSGTTVSRHMWGAIVLCIGLMLCVSARPAWISRKQPAIYPVLLTASLLALIWTGHEGGAITHGTGYLTRYMPRRLGTLFGAGSSSGAPADSFYTQHIHQVFEAKCVACHGEGTAKASLRLDSFNYVMHGGKDGAVVVPGQPEASMLLARVELSPGDPHFMPAEGRTPLTSDEVSWIRAWIKAGASSTALSIPGGSIEGARTQSPANPPIQPVEDYSRLKPEIQRMQSALGAKLVPVSANASDGLILRTVDVASTFKDSDLAQFRKFAPYIVEAELARTAITDASFDTLKTFTHLRALHLEGTSITGSRLGTLSALTQLNYLNLSGTRVTTQSIVPLKSMSQLHHLYLFNTPAQPVEAATRNAQ
ncbi:MAG: hypothetical protein KGN79_01060 [Acidobacteriota bacterium]|nr:hypothetical protein [Acidobacteriota bacterium]